MSCVRLHFLGSGDALLGADAHPGAERLGKESVGARVYRFRNFLTLEATPAGSRPCFA
jgi:hypothetical protein